MRQERNREGEIAYIKQEAAMLNERAQRLGVALRVVVVVEPVPGERICECSCEGAKCRA